MIGQKKLLAKINSYTIDTFPHTVLFAGEAGIGKNTITNYIKDNILKLPLIDITEYVSAEYIDEIYRTPSPNIYLINLSKITEKTQNALLKFAEEPLKNAFIIMHAESTTSIINTLLNRAVIFEFETYTKSELEQFITSEPDRDLILSIIRTPGKIKNTNINNLRQIFDMADKIVEKIQIASYPNTLSIAQKINYKDDYDKFDLQLFIDALTYSLFSHYLESNSIITLKMYEITRDQGKALLDKRINRELLVENLLTKLWQAARGN